VRSQACNDPVEATTRRTVFDQHNYNTTWYTCQLPDPLARAGPEESLSLSLSLTSTKRHCALDHLC
jgi:hypothetical protein